MSIDEQNAHPLYKDAHERFVRAEKQQNIKAAAKYPEPLNHASWTAEQLGDHFAQESVDQGRYVEALVAKCKALEALLRKSWSVHSGVHDWIIDKIGEYDYPEIDEYLVGICNEISDLTGLLEIAPTPIIQKGADES